MSGKRHAFLLACDDYEHYRKLNYSLSDAELLWETLTEWCDYTPDNVVLEQPKAGDPVAPGHVLSALRSLVDRTGDGDTILFFFAGHGEYRGGKAYIALPSSTPEDIETSGVSLNDISDVLRASNRFCVRIFDACHSGADARSDQERAADGVSFSQALKDDSSPNLKWVTLASCRPHERSYEDPELGHGIFTACLSDAIRDVPDGEPVEASVLYKKVYSRVIEASAAKQRTQTPVENRYVAGLDEIARRITRSKQIALTASPQAKPLNERLTAARELDQLLVKHRSAELTSAAEIARGLLDQQSDQIVQFGLAGVVVLGDTDLIPGNWKSTIVEHFDGLGVRSLHRLNSKTDPVSLYHSIRSFDRYSLPSKSYIIESTGYPDAIAFLSWAGDDYAPGGRVLCYIIPLETQTYVLVWLSVDSFVTKSRGITYTLQSFAQLDCDWTALLAPAIQRAVRLCATRIEESIEARLDYLDRERNRA